MQKIGLLIVGLSMVGFLSAAQANHHGKDEKMHEEHCAGMKHGDFSISGLDKNKDGVITQEEYLAGDTRNTEKLFKHMDANSDGKLDAGEQQEIEAVYQQIHQKLEPKKTNI